VSGASRQIAITLELMSFPQHYKSELLEAIESIDLTAVEAAIEVLRKARDEGRRIFTCGNGGSASTASHFACDIVKAPASVGTSDFESWP
jgi:D-sedoheptulose 7-phosphate isomerase